MKSKDNSEKKTLNNRTSKTDIKAFLWPASWLNIVWLQNGS